MPHRRKQAVALLRRQHRRRLVEDEDARLARQRFQDLQPLADADGQIADAAVGIDLQTMLFSEMPHEIARGICGNERTVAGLVVEHQVFPDREVRKLPECLVDHADPSRDGAERA